MPIKIVFFLKYSKQFIFYRPANRYLSAKTSYRSQFTYYMFNIYSHTMNIEEILIILLKNAKNLVNF